MRSIGIDIGSSRIKVAEVVASGKTYVIRDYFEFPLNPDPTQDNRVEILEALRKVAGHYDPHSTRYVVGLGHETLALRNRNFPFQERLKILKSLPFELEDEIPFDQSDAIFEAKAIRLTATGTDVLALAAPKPQVKKLLEIVQESGIEPTIIASDALAAGNSFEDWENAPPKALPEEGEGPFRADGLLIFGHMKTHLLVFTRGRLLTARSFFFGGYELADRLRKKYNIPIHEALKAVQEKGFVLTSKENASRDQVIFSDTLCEAIDRFIGELRVSLIELQTENPIKFEKLGMTGGLSALMNLAPYLTSRLELPVNPTQHLKNHPNVDLSASEEMERASCVAIGLALEGLKKPKNPPVNFRKGDFALQNLSFAHFIKKWNHALQLAAAAFVILCIYAFLRDSFSITLAETAHEALSKQGKALALKGNQASITGLKKFISEKKKEMSDRQALAEVQGINSAMDVLAALSQKFPPREPTSLDILRFHLTEETLILEGHAAQASSLKGLRTALEGFAVDRKVLDGSPTIKATDGKMAFAFQLTVERRTTPAGAP